MGKELLTWPEHSKSKQKDIQAAESSGIQKKKENMWPLTIHINQI